MQKVPMAKHAVGGRLVQRGHLLQDEQRQVREHRAGAGEHALGQEPARQLRLGQPVGDERPVGLHRGVVAGVEQPEADHAQPQGAHEREHEQDDRAEDRTRRDERSTTAPARVPGPVTDRADQWLDEQTGDRSGEVEDGELVGLRADQQEERVHRGLGEAEAELHAEEPEVHHQQLAARHQRAALVLGGSRRSRL